MRLAVVLVNFNAPERLARHVGALASQSSPPDALVLVNNGSQPVEWVRKEAKGRFPISILNFDNTGAAGGFREGARAAYRMGFDYIIFADDDAVPQGKDALAVFREDAGNGHPVVAGRYTTGVPITLSNHYFMVSREVFRRCGFYFHPFYIGDEDMEFPERTGRSFQLFHDGRITVEHPSRMTLDAQRTYYFLRNFGAHMAISGSARAFAFSFMAYFVRCSFIALFLGKRQFMDAFLAAMSDFSGCRLGRRRAFTDRIVPSPGALNDGDDALIIRHGREPKPLPPELAGAASEDWSVDNIFDPLMQGGGSIMGRAMRSAVRFRGKKLVLANHHFLSFPPFSIFTKSVYAYDEVGGNLGRLYENSPAASILFTAFAVPLALALAVPALAIFFLRRGAYRRMMNDMLRDDAEFCAAADKALKKEAGA